MAVPLVPMLSLASGIIGVLNKALDKPAASQGFESLLAGMTDSSQDLSSALLAGLTAKLKGQDVEGADLLASTQAGAMVLQLMAVLKQAGLGAADIQALLTGTGVQVSDEALNKILVSVGLSDTQIQAIMADKGLMAELKNEIVKNIQAAVGTDMPAAGLNMDQPVKQGEAPTAAGTAANAESAEDKARTPSANDHAVQCFGVPQKVAAAVQELVKAATRDDDTLDTLLKDMAPLSTTTPVSDLKTTLAGMIQQALKRAETKTHAVNVAAVDEIQAEAAQTDTKLTNALSTLQDTVGIKKDVLAKLFLSTDPVQRQAAVDEVAGQVAAYFKAQGDKTVSPEVKHALALVRQATNKEEWSTIESGIKLWRPDLQVPEARLALDKGAFNTLATKLTGSEASPVYERYVEQAIDQIKIQLPSQLRNSEGTATMRLNPPLLGRVDITIAMEDGGLQATIRSDSQITRDMLQIHIATLKDALVEQGIRVSQLNIAAGLDYRHNQHQDAYAQLQQGRSNADGQGRGSHQSGGGGSGRESGNGSYAETPARNYLLSAGALDLFA